MIKLINYYLFSVPVSFEIAKIHIPYSRHIIIELDISGRRGVGEGISYQSSLCQIEKYLSEINFNQVNVENISNKEPGLAAAIDQAIVSVSDRSFTSSIKINYTKQVFIMSVGKMIQEVEKLIQGGCRDIKLKLGRNVQNDIKLILILAKNFPQINFKADVNCGYSIGQFQEVLNANKGFIKVWEEPVIKNDQQRLLNLKEKYQIKIMLDESVRTLQDLKKYIDNKIIDILNIKLSRVGGISQAQKFVEMCHKNKIKISIGCSEELGVGMQAINHLAQQIPDVFGVEGVGKERLGFDIIDRNHAFSREKLFQASEKYHFKIFDKNTHPSFFNIAYEKIENCRAKFANLIILLKRS